ncbi:MAG: ornithine carbamoyltransferase [Alphaproteobacteria bacterium]|nr:ornithine carbamoyltransferase [Alphaproteobacteria bacterium]
MTLRHFLDLDVLSPTVLRGILDDATARKRRMKLGQHEAPLAGKALALIFEKPSTRTRVSFEVGMRQLGGHTVMLSPVDMHLGRGESIADTARVLSRYVDAIMIRTQDHAKLLDLAAHATVPVINGLTDRTHPCQLLADVMTFEEHRGPIRGKRVAWAGDGNNMAASWIHAAVQFGFELQIACADAYRPSQAILDWAAERQGRIVVGDDVRAAVRDADCVVTDTWVSMSDTRTDGKRELLEPYRIDAGIMALARPDAIFMHCLPAYREQEVTSEVIDGPRSAVWDEAENRLHAQKGILAWCLGAPTT